MNNEILGSDVVDPSKLSVGEYKIKHRLVVGLLTEARFIREQTAYHEIPGSMPHIPTSAPSGFLFINRKEAEILPLRAIGANAVCVRCDDTFKIKSDRDAKLTHSLCQYCQNDNNEWDWSRRIGGTAYTIGAMEADIKQYEGVTGAKATDAN